MKTELRLKRHAFLPGAFVIEVYYNGIFLATVAGAEGPGLRIISKHELKPLPERILMEADDPVKMIEVSITTIA